MKIEYSTYQRYLSITSNYCVKKTLNGVVFCTNTNVIKSTNLKRINFKQIYSIQEWAGWSPCGVMIKELDSDLKVSKFEI